VKAKKNTSKKEIINKNDSKIVSEKIKKVRWEKTCLKNGEPTSKAK